MLYVKTILDLQSSWAHVGPLLWADNFGYEYLNRYQREKMYLCEHGSEGLAARGFITLGGVSKRR